MVTSRNCRAVALFTTLSSRFTNEGRLGRTADGREIDVRRKADIGLRCVEKIER